VGDGREWVRTAGDHRGRLGMGEDGRGRVRTARDVRGRLRTTRVMFHDAITIRSKVDVFNSSQYPK